MQGLIHRATFVAAVSLCSLVSVGVAAQDLDSAREAIRKKDFDTASQTLAKLESEGSADARYLLAGLHRRGLGVSRNADLAADLYTELAAGGYEHALTLQRDTPAIEWPALVNPENANEALFWCAQTGRVELLEGVTRCRHRPRRPIGRTTHTNDDCRRVRPRGRRGPAAQPRR